MQTQILSAANLGAAARRDIDGEPTVREIYVMTQKQTMTLPLRMTLSWKGEDLIRRHFHHYTSSDEANIQSRIDTAESTVRSAITVPLMQNQFDALVAHVYFLPRPRDFSNSAIHVAINAGDSDEALIEMGKKEQDQQRDERLSDIIKMFKGG